ncbi:aminoacyl peptidase [Cystobacter fuscus]|uniref:Aminoacyl peptidase n=1 Tax=Cystobacter fuscus TaxID=43 RepID=A0A250J0F4_9BACT|nr:prolyl oligopeptidase family serine peptidase [Cystobacter fuscus]ATB36988.1 aminoacyl peptidase [Cystobacter fuscus]
MTPATLPVLAAILTATASTLAVESGYRTPPEPIASILAASPSPEVLVSPQHQSLALLGYESMPSIAQLSRPILRLAGYRIDPATTGQNEAQVWWLNALTLQDLATGRQSTVRLPEGTRYSQLRWSPDGRRLALVLERPKELELWVVEQDGSARRLAGAVNAAFGTAYAWLPDGTGFIVRQVRADRGAPPVADGTPTGPIIEENSGQTRPARTNPDALRGPADEALFEYYFTGQLVRVALDGSAPRPIGTPGLIARFSVSPDSRYLLTETLKRPFSYLLPADNFPREIAVATLDGQRVRMVVDRPLADEVPIDMGSVVQGPREVDWRADAPATLAWAEALDGGNPKADVPFHDSLWMQAAPFKGAPVKLADLKERFHKVYWGRADHALVFERKWKTRTERRSVVNPSRPGTARLLLERNHQDQYGDPGAPLLETNAAGKPAMRYTADGRAFLVLGPGATKAGYFPFVNRQEVASGQVKRLWTAQAPYYERVEAVLDADGDRLLTQRQSATEVPNYWLRTVKDGKSRAITSFKDPAPVFAGVTQKQITYARADGLPLSGMLYLPAGYDPKRDGPLPTLLWAYPAEYTDASVAGQTVDMSNLFTRPEGFSHLFMLTQGYAVLDNPAMPIVGANGAEPNDTYVEQLRANAEAAVEALVKLGVGDRDRMAVGGHSYGAFMTANLLAHTDLFRAGVARSGAYNRTLTPFGFQFEERTYWKAPEIYTRMSPFTYADRIREPLLLIHGGADNNPGTFPIQSERFYAAIKGNGGTARYVVLPNEAHGYAARESIGHVNWETVKWLDRYVKNAPPRAPATAADTVR